MRYVIKFGEIERTGSEANRSKSGSYNSILLNRILIKLLVDIDNKGITEFFKRCGNACGRECLGSLGLVLLSLSLSFSHLFRQHSTFSLSLCYSGNIL